MISNILNLWRGMDCPVGIILYECQPTTGRTRADLTAATIKLVIENEARTGTLVNADCDIDGDPTEGRILWTPTGVEFNALEYADEKPKRCRTYASVTKADGVHLYPVYGGYSYIWADIPLL